MTSSTDSTMSPATRRCSLDAADRSTRLREWQALRSEALIGERATDDVTTVVFQHSHEVMTRLRELIQAESSCCSFLRYSVTEDGENITVAITSTK